MCTQISTKTWMILLIHHGNFVKLVCMEKISQNSNATDNLDFYHFLMTSFLWSRKMVDFSCFVFPNFFTLKDTLFRLYHWSNYQQFLQSKTFTWFINQFYNYKRWLQPHWNGIYQKFKDPIFVRTNWNFEWFSNLVWNMRYYG